MTIDSFLFQPEANEGEDVTFFGQASGGQGPLTYTWYFGDGTTAGGVDLTVTDHVYNTNNPPDQSYTVTLVVSDGVTSDTQEGPILIDNVPPEVDAGPPQTVYPNTVVQFQGQLFAPGSAGMIAHIEWDFDYRGAFNADASGTLTPTHEYEAPGSYVVALRTTDTAGASAMAFTNVDVRSSEALIVKAGAPQNVAVGETVTFHGSYSGGMNVAPADIAWDFNYRGYFQPMVTGTLTPTYTFSNPGTYTVALRVNGHQCDTMGDQDFTSVKVSYRGPVSNTGGNQVIQVGETAAFSGSYSDPDGTVNPSGIAWSFNYQEDNAFSDDVTGTLTPSWRFNQAGAYIVALQVTDNHGVVSTSLLDVQVEPLQPYVYAGRDRSLAANDTTTFQGWYSMAGSVDTSGIEWDFSYDGTSFQPDPSATGNLTPTHQFADPGSYTVALRITDSNGVSGLATASVFVVNARLTVTANAEVDIAQGQEADFAATVQSNDPVRVQWDFDYQNHSGAFIADPSGDGELTPSHVYVVAGTALAAVRVTNQVGGAATLRTVVVHVDDVPPSAVVTDSGPTPEGSPVTFTLNNFRDIDPGATFGIGVDWTGGSNFEIVTDVRSGGVTLRHVFDDDGTYPVAFAVFDYEGGSTVYTDNVTVTKVLPAVRGISTVNIDANGPGVTVWFSSISDSRADLLAGLTYYLSVDGGDYTSNKTGDFILSSPGRHELRGYVEDEDGVDSAVYSTTEYFQDYAGWGIENRGSGTARMTWVGGGDPVLLGPNQTYYFTGPVSNLSITLLNSGTSYDLRTNGSIDQVDYDTGVQSVTLSVETYGDTSLPANFGDGHIGTIYLPGGSAAAGSSRLDVGARGSLGNVVGPSGDGKLWAYARFLRLDGLESLTGSITGLDYIGSLEARGWLGTSGSVVWANCGIDLFNAAQGVRADVTSDRLRSPDTDPGDPDSFYIGYGGSTGKLDLASVALFDNYGAVNDLRIRSLTGRVEMENLSSIGRFLLDNNLGGPIVGDYGRIDQLVLGPAAVMNAPVLGLLSIGSELALGSTDYRTNFWSTIPKDVATFLRAVGYQVHHTKMQALRAIYLARG